MASRFLKVKFKNIPSQLKGYTQWLVWNEELNKKGELTKIPRQAIFGFPASVTNPRTWCKYKITRKECKYHHGLGFVLTSEDLFVGIDLDHCRDPKTRKIEKWAMKIIKRLNSYTEISPSGKGIRIFVIAELPGPSRTLSDIEIYETGRYLTITGHRLNGMPKKIKKRQKAIEEIYHEAVHLYEREKQDLRMEKRRKILESFGLDYKMNRLFD